jgi:nucleoside-diphosphate-sugar epimerase
MNDLVAGYHGFIGSHLVELMEKQGKKVVSIPREAIIHKDRLEAFLGPLQPFRIYYLSAYGNLHGQDDIHLMYEVIVNRLLTLLEVSKDMDCQGFITTGTTSEYGYKKEPMKEDQILVPTSFYGAAKAAATHLAQAWAIQYDKPIVVYRPASVVGVREHKIHLIPTIIRSCLYKEPMEFIPEPTHDYIAVEDVVRAIALLGEKAWECKGGIFNVGTGRQWTNQQVLTLIENITGKKANIIGLKNMRVFEKSETWIADSSLMNSLGWESEITLYESLKRMIEHERTN